MSCWTTTRTRTRRAVAFQLRQLSEHVPPSSSSSLLISSRNGRTRRRHHRSSIFLFALLLLVFTTVILKHVVVFVDAHWPHDTVDAMAVSADRKEIFVVVRATLLQSIDGGITWKYIRPVTGKPTFRVYLALSTSIQSSSGTASTTASTTRTLYMLSGNIMMRSTGDLTEWETLDVEDVRACKMLYYNKLKRRMTFTTNSNRALIAGLRKIYIEKDVDDPENIPGNRFDRINIDSFSNCPSLSTDPLDNNIIYAGATNGLMKSIDSGKTWSLLVPIEEGIIDVVATSNDGIFVSTIQGTICRYHPSSFAFTSNVACIDMQLPDVTDSEKVRHDDEYDEHHPSPPISISYFDKTLAVVRANCYAVYLTKDFGVTWEIRNQLNGDFPNDGHGGDDAWDFDGSEEFTHAEYNFIGSWIGTYSTLDAGITWKYSDTIRDSITTLGLTKKQNGDFHIVACTYANGCYQGPHTKLDSYPLFDEGYYDAMYLSPRYDVDGIGFLNTGRALRRLDRSIVDLPLIVDGDSACVKSVLFSPIYGQRTAQEGKQDATVFVAGYNLGVLVSYDSGITFKRIFDADGYMAVNKLVLSPTYDKDGTMACQVDLTYRGNGKGWSVSELYIYVSTDYGQNWYRITNDRIEWRDIILVNTYIPLSQHNTASMIENEVNDDTDDANDYDERHGTTSAASITTTNTITTTMNTTNTTTTTNTTNTTTNTTTNITTNMTEAVASSNGTVESLSLSSSSSSSSSSSFMVGPAIVIAIGDDRIMYASPTLGLDNDEQDVQPPGMKKKMKKRGFRMVKSSRFPQLKPHGYVYDGMAVTPASYDNGTTLAASWVEGGIVFGNIVDVTSDNGQYYEYEFIHRHFSRPNPWVNEEIDSQYDNTDLIVFGRQPVTVEDSFGRAFTSKIIYSPHYAKDNIMFAASMFSIYVSTNHGKDWTMTFTLDDVVIKEDEDRTKALEEGDGNYAEQQYHDNDEQKEEEHEEDDVNYHDDGNMFFFSWAQHALGLHHV